MSRIRGRPTEDHFFVGRSFLVMRSEDVGRCVSVTTWGNDRVRWMKLRFRDGSMKSFALSHLVEVKEPVRKLGDWNEVPDRPGYVYGLAIREGETLAVPVVRLAGSVEIGTVTSRVGWAGEGGVHETARRLIDGLEADYAEREGVHPLNARGRAGM